MLSDEGRGGIVGKEEPASYNCGGQLLLESCPLFSRSWSVDSVRKAYALTKSLSIVDVCVCVEESASANSKNGGMCVCGEV